MIGSFFLAYVLGVIHECCHFAAAKAMHLPVKRFSFWLWGTGVVVSPIPLPRKEFLVSAAGPLFHLIMMPVFDHLPRMKLLNATMLIINLLPALPLDGGRMLKSAFLCVLPVRKVRLLCHIGTFLTGIAVFFLVAWSVLVLRRMTAAFFLLLFLFLSASRTDEEHSLGLMKRIAGERETIRKFGNGYAVNMDRAGSSVLREVFATKENIYFLTQGERVCGILSETMILDQLGRLGSAATLRKIFREAVENERKIGYNTSDRVPVRRRTNVR